MIELGNTLLFDLDYSNFRDISSIQISKELENIKSFLSNKFTPGIYQGNALKKILLELHRYIMQKIEQLISLFDKEDLLFLAADQLGRIAQYKFLKMRDMFDNYKKKNESEIILYNKEIHEIAGLLFSTQFIIEKTVQMGKTNTNKIDHNQYSEMLSTTKILIDLSMVYENIQNNILNYTLKISDDYTYEFETHSVEKADEFYIRALQNNIYGTEITSTSESTLDIDEIDPYFFNEFGLTYTNFYRLLIICISFLRNQSLHTVRIKKLRLIREIRHLEKEWIFDRNTINSFLRILCISTDDLINDFSPTHIRNRKNRIMIKPFIDISTENNCEYIINIWILFTCSKRWIDEISQGFLPYKDDFILTNLKDKLAEIRRKHNEDFENQVRNLVKRKTPFYETKIKENEKCFSSLPEPCTGEIDVFAIFKEKFEVYLVDAKDFQLSRLPRDMSHELHKYIQSSKGYFVKMKQKKNYVKKYLEIILNYYGIEKGINEWNIKCFFVTSNASMVYDEEGARVLTTSQFTQQLELVK